MFKTSHLQELKRRYASMYASPVEEEVIEDGTIEGADQYKKDTPGQEADIDEGTALQVKMALDDVGLKGKWKNEKVYVKKRDVKKAEKALKGNVIYRGKPPVVVGEEVEIDEEVLAEIDYKYDGKVVKISKKNFSKVHKDYKNSTKGKERMLINDPKTNGTISVPVQFEEVEIDEAKGTAFPATIDTLRKIVKDKQNQVVMFKSGQARVDLFTASAMVQVYDALKKPDMKKTFEKMIADKAGFLKTQAFAMKMVG